MWNKQEHIKIFMLFLTFMLIYGNIYSQEVEQQKITEEYEKLGLPGVEHEMLAKMEGKWSQTYKNYMVPNTEPITAVGEGTMEMILGGRFLKWISKGELLGRKIEGMTILGFDNRLKNFTLHGFDNMGTYGITAEGKLNKENGIVEYKGKNFEPSINAYSDFRMLLKPGEKEFTFELYITMPDKKEVKVLETVGRKSD